MPKLTATEVARNFSDVLNRVAAGEEIEITRNGSTVALLRPAKVRLMSAERFRELMAAAPRADPGFINDLRAIRKEAGPPPDDPWAS